MTRYIDVVGLADKLHEMLGIEYSNMVDVLSCVDTADVEKVVRCKDCKYMYETYYGVSTGCNKMSVVGLDGDFYCGYGKMSVSQLIIV